MASTLDIKSLVFNTPVIIENIFQHLPAFDLCKCACVNKFWKSISTAELNRRKKPVHFYQEYSDERSFASYGGCSMKNAKTFEEDFDQQIKNLEIKPAFCIAFATGTLWENFEKFFPSHPIYEPKKMKFDKYKGTPRQRHLESIINTALKKRLPPDCKVCLYVGMNIIGILRNSNKVVQQQTPAISGYLFPELPQEGIQFCRISNCEEFRITATQKNLKSSLVLMNYNSIEYYTTKLKRIWRDLSENSVVFPVTIGSDVIPLFFGPNVKTTCFETPRFDSRINQVVPAPSNENQHIRNLEDQLDEINIKVIQEPFNGEKDFQILQELEKSDFSRNGVIAFMFAKSDYDSFVDFCEGFHKKFPFIPIAGLKGIGSRHIESIDHSKSKCLLISINYS